MATKGDAISRVLQQLSQMKDQLPPPESTDAITVLDTGSTLGAVSAQNEKRVQEDAAKQPPPEYSFTIGSDGVLRMTATNVPAVSPVRRAEQARSEPYARFADSLRKTMEQSARLAEQAPDPENVPDDPEALASELGVERPALGRDGLLGYASRLDAYDKVIANRTKLRESVAAQRLKQRVDLLGEGTKAYNAAKAIEVNERADRAADRQDAMSRETLLQHLITRDPTGYGSPEKYLETVDSTMKNVFGEGADEAEKARALSSYVTGMRKAELERLKAEEAAADNDEDRRVTKLRIAKLEDDLAGEGPRKKRRVSTSESYLSRVTADQLIARAGDDAYEEDSVAEAIDMAADQWLRESEKNSAEFDQNKAEAAAADVPMWKRDRLKERNKYLQQRNRRLLGERRKLLQFMDGDTAEPALGEKAPVVPLQRPTPARPGARKVLSPDEALARLP